MSPPRHLIILFDGTNCTATRGLQRNLTNLFSIGVALKGQKLPSESDPEGGEQIIFYFPGPGARSSLAAPLERAFGHGINAIIMEAYLAIANNLQSDKDRIYIFGYSRGAIAAKALVSLLATSGVVRRNFLHRFKHAWCFYKGDGSSKVFLSPDVVEAARIPFVGLFDPVLGPPTSLFDISYSRALEKCVDFAVEIVACDEFRLSYDQDLWLSEDLSEHDSLYTTPLRTTRPQLQQIWMPGSHGDIGGQEGNRLLGGIALLTMLERVQARAGLSLDAGFVQKLIAMILSCEEIRISTPRRYAFRPIQRAIGTTRKIARSSVTYLHPLVDLLSGKAIYFGNRRQDYGLRNGEDAIYNRYDFGLAGLLPHLNPSPEQTINARVQDILSQV